MCGIAGAVGAGSDYLVDETTAERMCQVIRHRGPDDQGIYRAAPATLGMRRLSIIDLAGGHQPMQNEDGSVWLVFNGEIYNFQELRLELEAKGHTFRTQSDSEAIVHCYEEYGERSFARLRGMFAIAIWDTRNRSLWLARDRLGKKPLFYAVTDRGIAFASEIKSLLEIKEQRRELVPDAISDFLTLGYVPAPGSIFKGVEKLLPGHLLEYRQGKVRNAPYWTLPFAPKWDADERELEERLFQKLDESVRIRLVSDVPFGAFLSGGLDSSLVVSLMARHLSTPVKTFTIGFNEKEFSEVEDARAVARHIQSDHHELIVEPDAVQLLHDLVWHFDEPFGDSSAIPTYLVSKLAAGHVKMVLSGDGGDELFAGYERYQKYQVVERLAGLPLGIGKIGVSAAGHVLPGRLGERARWLSRRASQPYPDRYLSGVALTTPELVKELLGRGEDTAPFGRVAPHFADKDGATGLDRVMAGDIRTYLVDDILAKVDRMSMAHSIEARAPLLDHELVELAARMPLSTKLGPEGGKRLFRRAAARALPQSTLTKKKQGFAIPLAKWFRNELKPLALDTLSSKSFVERGIFNPKAAQSLAHLHVEGTSDHGEHLWLLLTFELWARRFLDTHPA